MPLKSVIFCAVILLLMIPLSISSQPQGERVLDWYQGAPRPETKVLEIVEIKVEGKPISFGRPFHAGRDWFKSLVFRVRNISGKPVKMALISFNVPELDGDSGKRIYEVPYAIQRVGVSSSGADIWDWVGPGDEVNLTFTRLLLKSALHEAVEKFDGEVYRVHLHPVVMLTFKDGSSARGGFRLVN